MAFGYDPNSLCGIVMADSSNGFLPKFIDMPILKSVSLLIEYVRFGCSEKEESLMEYKIASCPFIKG